MVTERHWPAWRSRRVVLTTLAALVAAAGGGAFALSHRTPTATAQPRTVTVSHGTVQQTVVAAGTIEPATEDDVTFQSPGTVSTVGVGVGQKVSKGQVLASIDPSALKSDLTLAEAVVTQAQAQVTAANASGSASQIAAANAQLASAQAKLSSAQAALRQATLTSPIDGVVASVNVRVGDSVSGSVSGSLSGSTSGSGSASSAAARGYGGSGPGSGSLGGSASSGSAVSAASSSSSSAAVSVISTDSWVVQTAVANADLPALKPGLQVQILPTGSRTMIFGTVQSIGIVATSSSSGTSQFPVVVAVTGSPSGLYAGTVANVSIIVKQLANVLTVPTSALSTTGGRTVVNVLRGTQSVATPVTLGRIFGARTEITAGLSDGEQVVLPDVISRLGGAGSGLTGTGGLGTRPGGFGGGGFGGGGFNGGSGAPNGG